MNSFIGDETVVKLASFFLALNVQQENLGEKREGTEEAKGKWLRQTDQSSFFLDLFVLLRIMLGLERDLRYLKMRFPSSFILESSSCFHFLFNPSRPGFQISQTS